MSHERWTVSYWVRYRGEADPISNKPLNIRCLGLDEVKAVVCSIARSGATKVDVRKDWE